MLHPNPRACGARALDLASLDLVKLTALVLRRHRVGQAPEGPDDPDAASGSGLGSPGREYEPFDVMRQNHASIRWGRRRRLHRSGKDESPKMSRRALSKS
jgi:hypothetical protein